MTTFDNSVKSEFKLVLGKISEEVFSSKLSVLNLYEEMLLELKKENQNNKDQSMILNV
jgi:hypothetical protein